MALEAPASQEVKRPNSPIPFTLRNTGTPADTDPAMHPVDATKYLNSDVYRLSVSMEGEGWTVQLLNGLAAVEFGTSQQIEVYVSYANGSAPSAEVTLRAVSESDPTKTATATVQVSR